MNDRDIPTGFLLHAGAVHTTRGAIIFTGASGAGKSTICRLLEARYPTIADDTVWISRTSLTEWSVRAAQCPLHPHSGTVDPLPVRAVMPLEQARENELIPIDSSALCVSLMNGLVEIAGQSKTHRNLIILRLFGAAASLGRAVPGYRLRFTKSSSTGELIEAFIQEKRTGVSRHRRMVNK